MAVFGAWRRLVSACLASVVCVVATASTSHFITPPSPPPQQPTHHTTHSFSIQVPELRVVMEHITTADAAAFVAAGPASVAASVTPQHMLLNRNALFLGGLRPHAFCLPILKREEHRQAVAAAATSGSPKFFLGTDSGEELVHLLVVQLMG